MDGSPQMRIDSGRVAVQSERTNITAVNPSSEISVYAPNAGLTSAGRRHRRYSAAEQALSVALERHRSEQPSSRELQMRVLEDASAVLRAGAVELRERIATLRLRLTARDASPAVYSAMQHERWRAEKRVQVLTQQLASLEADRFDRGTSSLPARGNEARWRANLVRFFHSSPTKTDNLKCRFVLVHPLPTMTMTDVSPLRLRPSSVTPLRRFTTRHTRPASVGNDLFNPVKRQSKPRVSSPTPSVKAAESSPKAQSSGSCRLPASSVASTSDDSASTPPPTPPPSITSEGSSSLGGPSESRGGMATIISHVSPRTRAEVLADFNQDDVHVPDYALNLLGNLDLIPDRFALPDRDLFVKPREMKPIEVAPPPPETPPPSDESDTGPYTSFALPPFAMEPSWSHISLNSPPSPSTPRMQRASLQPLVKSGSSSPSRSSTPTTPRASTKAPRNRQSLLFYMRKRTGKDSFGENSPASSISRIDPLPENTATVSPSKKRFSLFSRK